MIHFLWSIFFLLLTMALVLAYVVAGIVFSWLFLSFAYLIWRIFFFLFMRIMVMETVSLNLDRPLRWLKNFSTKKRFIKRSAIFLLVTIFVTNLGLYINQRQQWMGPDNSNFAAKQYFVVGQVVDFHRKFISLLLHHPDNFSILVPLNTLQKIIYRIGVRQLPEDDAEKAVWADLWFVYIYSKNNRLPYAIFDDRTLDYDEFRGTDGRIVTMDEALLGKTLLMHKKNKFMDLVWFCLKTMATQSFADKEMEEFHYLRNFAGEAQYYAYNAPGGYTKLYRNSGHFYDMMPSMTARNEKLVNWLRILPAKWKKSDRVADFIQKHPKVDAMRQTGLIMTLVEIFQARIWAGQFSCDDPYLQYLREVRQEFAHGVDGKPPSWKRMPDKRTAKIFYEIAVNSYIARFTNFVTEYKCGEPLPGKEDMREFQKRAISPENARKRLLRNLFSRELQLLGMTDVLTEKYWTRTVHGYEYR